MIASDESAGVLLAMQSQEHHASATADFPSGDDELSVAMDEFIRDFDRAQAQESDGPDIVVTGTRIYDGFGYGGLYNEGTSSSAPERLPEPEMDCQSTTASLTDDAPLLREPDAALIGHAMDVIERLQDGLGTLKADESFAVDNAGFNGQEYYDLAVRADIRLDDNSADYGNAPEGTSGSAGTADRNGGNPILTIRQQDFLNYARLGDDAIEYYFLHEIAHTTEAGYDRNLAAGNNATPQQHTANEVWANTAAKMVADAIGNPFDEFTPSDGYTTTPGTHTNGTGSRSDENGGCQ